MTLIRPRFIALDSSQLGDLARDSQAGDRSRRDAAGDFLSSFAANGCVLLLCWHHFEELLRHRNRDVVGKRISFFRSLDFVAWIKSARDDDPSPGGIVDILAFEADQAFKDAKADPVAIRDRVLPNLIRCGRGREVIAPFAADLDRLQPWFWQREQQEREIIAIARSSTIDFGNTKVMDWWKGRWRSLDDAHGALTWGGHSAARRRKNFRTGNGRFGISCWRSRTSRNAPDRRGSPQRGGAVARACRAIGDRPGHDAQRDGGLVCLSEAPAARQ